MGEQYVTSLGVTVECMPVSPMLIDKINAAYKPPEPPYYEIKAATGAIERHAHDETTLETDADKTEWKAYLTEKARIDNEHNRAITRLMLLKGLKVEYPADEGWVKEQEYLGVVVPQDPIERRLHYIETCVVGTTDDLTTIMRGIGKASGASEEYLAQAEDSFRRAVGRAGRDETERPTASGNGQGVVLQPKVRGGTRRARPKNAAG